MKLGEFLRRAKDEYSEFVLTYQYIKTGGFGGLEITGITDDSRRVKPGFIFVAVKGLQSDGHDYILKATEAGAAVVVFQDETKLPGGNYVKLKFSNSRRVLGLLWAAWYEFPSKKLKVIGVTGTDGKTTTVNLIYHILKSAGKKVGLVSTINARIGSREIDTGFHVTNPEPELLQKLLSEMVVEEMEYAVVEITSHGIDQERIAGLDVFGAAITNVTHEHLDYHKTYEDYLKTKGKIFKDVSFSALNYDDSSYEYLSKTSLSKTTRYSIRNLAVEVSADSIELCSDTSRFILRLHGSPTSPLHCGEVTLKIPGLYNISNATAAASVCLELGLSLEEVTRGLESFVGLVGRFEKIYEGQNFKVIVDFAHTPNALKQVLELCGRLKVKGQRLIVVFGCAGERDKEKRPMMGEIAGRLADVSVVTAEDPRREDLHDIINSIAGGCLKSGAHEIQKAEIKDQRLGKEHYFIRVPDRREAIETAFRVARDGDTVIITGKGHEKSMCFGTTEYPWSDQKVAKELLSKLELKRSK